VRGEASRRANSCLSQPQDTYPAIGIGGKGLFKKARQFVGKLIKKPFNYSKKATNTVHASHVSVQRVKKARQMVNLLCQKNIQLVGKTFALVKYSIQETNLHSDSFGLCLSELPLRALVALVKNLVKSLFALFGFLVGFSAKHSTFQDSIQCSGCQMPELSQRTCFMRGPECGRIGTAGGR
jgi:hypothetical protein